MWWTGGAQSELMKTRRGRHEPACGTRAQTVMDEGAPVAISWHNNIWGVEGWSILTGTPKADMCREFIKFASDPKRMAA